MLGGRQPVVNNQSDKPAHAEIGPQEARLFGELLEGSGTCFVRIENEKKKRSQYDGAFTMHIWRQLTISLDDKKRIPKKWLTSFTDDIFVRRRSPDWRGWSTSPRRTVQSHCRITGRGSAYQCSEQQKEDTGDIPKFATEAV